MPVWVGTTVSKAVRTRVFAWRWLPWACEDRVGQLGITSLGTSVCPGQRQPCILVKYIRGTDQSCGRSRVTAGFPPAEALLKSTILYLSPAMHRL